VSSQQLLKLQLAKPMKTRSQVEDELSFDFPVLNLEGLTPEQLRMMNARLRSRSGSRQKSVVEQNRLPFNQPSQVDTP
jgi:hypothetical protein